jgi:hypothetical protein
MAYLSNFVRLTGTIETVETSTKNDRLDHILLKADNGTAVWCQCDMQRHRGLEFRRDLWRPGLRVVALGTLDSDGEVLFVSVFGLFTEENYRKSTQKVERG